MICPMSFCGIFSSISQPFSLLRSAAAVRSLYLRLVNASRKSQLSTVPPMGALSQKFPGRASSEFVRSCRALRSKSLSVPVELLLFFFGAAPRAVRLGEGRGLLARQGLDGLLGGGNFLCQLNQLHLQLGVVEQHQRLFSDTGLPGSTFSSKRTTCPSKGE